MSVVFPSPFTPLLPPSPPPDFPHLHRRSPPSFATTPSPTSTLASTTAFLLIPPANEIQHTAVFGEMEMESDISGIHPSPLSRPYLKHTAVFGEMEMEMEVRKWRQLRGCRGGGWGENVVMVDFVLDSSMEMEWGEGGRGSS